MVAQHIIKENMDNSTVLEMHFPPTVKVYMEMYLYELISMIAGESFRLLLFGSSKNDSIPEVGGYLGIFLGISLFDLRILGSVVTEKYISTKVEDTKNDIAVMEGVKDGWVK